MGAVGLQKSDLMIVNCETRKLALRVLNVSAGYDGREVVKDVSFDLGEGEVGALTGHNGSGKSTLLKAIFGLIPIRSGSVWLSRATSPNPTPRDLVRAGVVYVPQGARVFGDLSVRDNLGLNAVVHRKDEVERGIDRALVLFPRLGRQLGRQARDLSGGERQMLALAAAIASSPKVLFVDEPSFGLTSVLFSEVLDCIQHMSADSNVTTLIAEHKMPEVLKIADHVLALRSGHVCFAGSAREFDVDGQRRDTWP